MIAQTVIVSITKLARHFDCPPITLCGRNEYQLLAGDSMKGDVRIEYIERLRSHFHPQSFVAKPWMEVINAPARHLTEYLYYGLL
jgi:hypothetical protein